MLARIRLVARRQVERRRAVRGRQARVPRDGACARRRPSGDRRAQQLARQFPDDILVAGAVPTLALLVARGRAGVDPDVRGESAISWFPVYIFFF